MLQAVASFTAATGWNPISLLDTKNAFKNLRAAGKSPVWNPQNPELLTCLKSCIRFGQFLQSDSAAFLKDLWSFRIVIHVAVSWKRDFESFFFAFFYIFHTADIKWIVKGMECVGAQLKFDWLTLSLHCL